MKKIKKFENIFLKFFVCILHVNFMKNEKNWNDNKIKIDNDNIQCYVFGWFFEKN